MTHEAMNALIRRAARGGVRHGVHNAPDVPHEGRIGIGLGGAARAVRPDPATRMNAAIREAGWRVKHRVDAGGVDLDDLLARR
jgi:hypothetical protein